MCVCVCVCLRETVNLTINLLTQFEYTFQCCGLGRQVTGKNVVKQAFLSTQRKWSPVEALRVLQYFTLRTHDDAIVHVITLLVSNSAIFFSPFTSFAISIKFAYTEFPRNAFEMNFMIQLQTVEKKISKNFKSRTTID